MLPSHQVTCASLSGLQVQARTKTHAWLADAAPSVGGDGLAPSPLEILLGAFGACMIIVVTAYARQAKIALEGMTVELQDEWRKDGDKERYCIRAQVRLQGSLSPTDIERLTRAAERCPVRRILDAGATIENTFTAA